MNATKTNKRPRRRDGSFTITIDGVEMTIHPERRRGTPAGERLRKVMAEMADEAKQKPQLASHAQKRADRQ